MTQVLSLTEIKQLLPQIDVVEAMEDAFITYSNGNAVVPPVGELLFEEQKGEVHIKYGYIKKEEFYAIKIASGFYNNPQLGLNCGQGLMLLFRQKTGEPEAILLDAGYLTDVRTAAAGALAAQYFAPKNLKGIGIIGTGTQATLQLQYLQKQQTCKTVWVWGRNRDKAQEFKAYWQNQFDVHIAETPAEVAQNANLIVTTTPAKQALLQASDIQKGTHITAVGSDTEHKQELASSLLTKADLVIVDSLPQSKNRGEIYRAIKEGILSETKVQELGMAIQHPLYCRTNDQQISIVDLTGVAVQDIKIAEAVYRAYLEQQQL